MDIDNLIERLMSLTYKHDGGRYDFDVISEDHRDKVTAEIMSWYKTQDEVNYDKKRIAELEAKVYAYEKIIANSNFAPIIREISIREISEEK